jgi:hypothetical protein
MAGNAAFLRSESTRAWLATLDIEDQRTAEQLLRAMALVSRDAFADHLRQRILMCLDHGPGPVGLYVERELEKPRDLQKRLFAEPDQRPRRAYGEGPLPISPVGRNRADIGSEGIVAQLVSALCRERRQDFLNHPGPDEIRAKRVRRFVLVTDLVASGDRSTAYLSAAWNVRSVRSWWSARRRCGMSFEVVTYATTEQGRERIEQHPSEPVLSAVIRCPTIDNTFSGERRKAIYELCNKYAPRGTKLPPRGYGSIGALIAFAHSAPNNAPTLLHVSTPERPALFPARVTLGMSEAFSSEAEGLAIVRERFLAMKQSRLAEASGLERIRGPRRKMLLMLAAASRVPRTAEDIAHRTGLTIMEVEKLLAYALSAGWVSGTNRPTKEGLAELAHARSVPLKQVLPIDSEAYYCPTQLRALRTI